MSKSSDINDMKPNMKIFDSMKHRMPYDTPEGFFDDMQKTLLAIPQRESLAEGLPMHPKGLMERLLSWRKGSVAGELSQRVGSVADTSQLRKSVADRLLRGRPIFSWRVAGTAVGALALAALALFVLLRQPSEGSLDACAEEVLAATMQAEQIEEYLADSGISVYQLTDYLD